MAKRKRSTTEKTILKRKDRGRGKGKDYTPYHHIQDVPSKGLSTRVNGWKTGRIHHFLSKLEWLYFFLLDWSPSVIDIREQYPLEIQETIKIAERLGIRHPVDPKTKHPIVMTTDFVLTIKRPIGSVEHARTVKYTKDLNSRRVLEKLEIERLYWLARGIDWGIVTEQEINRIVAANVEWLHPFRRVESCSHLSKQIIKNIESVLYRRVTTQEHSLKRITSETDLQLGLNPGSSLMVVRYLLASCRWKADMTQPLQPSRRLILVG